MGVLLCDALGYNKNLLIPVTMNEVGYKYPVQDVSMDTDTLWGILNIPYKDVAECIYDLVEKLNG